MQELYIALFLDAANIVVTRLPASLPEWLVA